MRLLTVKVWVRILVGGLGSCIPTAENTVSKAVQCRFESDQEYQALVAQWKEQQVSTLRVERSIRSGGAKPG